METPETPKSTQRAAEPLSFESLESNRLYWIRLVFPSSLNETSPLSHRVKAGKAPVFRVGHLDKMNSEGYWRVDRRRQLANYFRPCLLLRVLPESKSVTILVASSDPSQAHRWIPFEGTSAIARQPDVFVKTTPTECFDGYLNFTHILEVKPVGRWEIKPQSEYPGIVHFARPVVDDSRFPIVTCGNTNEILSLHRTYWEARGALWEQKESNDGDSGQMDDGDSGQRDDGDSGQRDDGDSGQRDDGDSGQRDDGDSGQRDDGDSSQRDDGDSGQRDDGGSGQKGGTNSDKQTKRGLSAETLGSQSLEKSLSNIDFLFEIVTEAFLGIEDGIVTTPSDADLLIAEADADLLTAEAGTLTRKAFSGNWTFSEDESEDDMGVEDTRQMELEFYPFTATEPFTVRIIQ